MLNSFSELLLPLLLLLFGEEPPWLASCSCGGPVLLSQLSSCLGRMCGADGNSDGRGMEDMESEHFRF